MSLPCTQRWTRRWPRTQAGSACNRASKCSSIRSSVRSRYVLDGGHGRTSFADSRAVQEIAAERDSDADGHGDGQIRNAEVPPVARRIRGRRRVTGSSRNLHRRASTLHSACFNIAAHRRSSFCMGATRQAAIELSLRTTACSLYLWLCSRSEAYPACRSFEQRGSAEACHRSSNTGACSHEEHIPWILAAFAGPRHSAVVSTWCSTMAICGDAHAAASSEDRTRRTQADSAERPTAKPAQCRLPRIVPACTDEACSPV